MDFKKILPFILAILGFIVVALLYFSPVLKGEKIYQSDNIQFTGMSKEIQDYRAEYHQEPYWTDAAFSGLPAYQVSAHFPHEFIQKVDELLRFLPRPADYLFLYFLGFFVLLIVIKTDWRLAMIGAFAFGFSTYLIIIIGVGHNAKAYAIAYFPLVLAGVWLIFRQNYFWGFLLTTLSAALEIATGHVQMTYYLFFILFIFGLSEIWQMITSKNWKNLAITLSLLIISGLLALGMNANHLLPTQEFAKESTRSHSELTFAPDGSEKDNTGGLDRDYITDYSYGILETFNLFIPRFTGGGNAEDVGTNSATFNFLRDKIGRAEAKSFSEHAPTYWGNQPIVAAPAYIGAVVIFFFVLALFLVEKRLKLWMLVVLGLALLLSWGKNFGFLTNFFIDYIPMYNKFRAVSSIQVILEFLLPVMAVLGLQQFIFNDKIDPLQKEKALKFTLYITGGIALFFLILGRSWFSFESASDAQYDQMIAGFTDALISDRKSMFTADTLRTLILVLLATGVMWAYLKKKLNVISVLALLGILFLYDGVGVARRYVNQDDFERASKIEKPFEMSDVDRDILKDTTFYRVANFAVNPLNDGTTSYFHHSIGGYHAAKPRRYQELFDYQLSAKNNFEILNMLNAKYFIFKNEKGETQWQLNDSIYGNAWFAHNIQLVNSADEEMKRLEVLSPTTAIINKTQFPQFTNTFAKDTTAVIELQSSLPNQKVYKYSSQQPQLALFSEMYYPKGWKATIDGKETPIIRANYVLRALEVPSGNHTINFSFEPQIVNSGAQWSLVSYILFLVFAIASFFINKLALRRD